MTSADGNLFQDVLRHAAEERLTELASGAGAKVERIVSTGQSSPPGFWYDQDWAEWILVISGSAAVLFEGETAPRELRRGDYLLIPPRRRHRVEWTDPNEPTLWLAVHFAGEPAATPD